MVHTQIALPEKVDGILSSLATKQGKKKEEIILDAVQAYIREPVSRREPLSHEEILERRRRAFGMWKDRRDLPDFDQLGRSRKLNWDE
ncbi:MAG TPA: CopG family transcriptional regulator [Candidatus Kapabacteria bacterium]|nr:CopG family transcriptional regulator [Candidatus Kapabacteria bacterium]